MKNIKKIIQKKKLLIGMLSLAQSFSLPSYAQNYKTYVVKDGDCLTKILSRHNLKPIYGKDGSLQKLLEINAPTIKIKDYIFRSQVIFLPEIDDNYRLPASAEELTDEVKEAKEQQVLLPPLQEKAVVPELSQKKFSPLVPKQKIEIGDDSVVSHIEVKGGVDYLLIKGINKADGADAKLLSKASSNIGINWNTIVNNHWGTQIYFSQRYLQMQPEFHGIQLINDKVSLSKFGFILSRYVDDFSFGLGLNYGELPFYRKPVLGSLEVNYVPILNLEPYVKYNFFNKGRFILSLGGSLSRFSSSKYSDYSISSGNGYEVNMEQRYILKSNNSIFCRLSYGERKQSTSLVELEEKNAGLMCGLGLSL